MLAASREGSELARITIVSSRAPGRAGTQTVRRLRHYSLPVCAPYLGVIFQVNSMHPALNSIVDELIDGKIEYQLVGGAIHVGLPRDFDTLVIEIWNDEGDDSISLLNGSFHTHGNIEAYEYGLLSREKGIRHLIECIFNGTFKMIKRPGSNGEIENTIWDTFSLNLVKEGDVFDIVEI